MPVGRPPLGAELVDRTDGSAEAKKRVAVILQTLAGDMTVPQACLELAIGESRFHELRNELLQYMVQGAEAKPRGRPPADPVDARVAQLQQELASLKLDLRAAQIREDLAVMLPNVLHRPRAGDKKKIQMTRDRRPSRPWTDVPTAMPTSSPRPPTPSRPTGMRRGPWARKVNNSIAIARASCVGGRWPSPAGHTATASRRKPPPSDSTSHPGPLAVRDLASHNQLLALPVPNATAAVAVAALQHLFAAHGAPLVIKSDNGGPFIADEFQDLLDTSKVIPLLSPPNWPMYNGAIEAGFGPLKTRIFYEASKHGRNDHWLSDDVEAARLLANALSHPWGRLDPTPQQRWNARVPITDPQRSEFRQVLTVQLERVKARLGLGLIPELHAQDRATVARQAVGQTLQALGYLQVQRKRLTPPFKLSKVGKIS